MSRRAKKKSNKAGRLSISCIMLLLLAVMSVQIVQLYEKNEDYTQRMQTLSSQLKDEQKRAADISSYEEYTKTPQCVEDIAKSKLGLVYNNEIVFKEK